MDEMMSEGSNSSQSFLKIFIKIIIAIVSVVVTTGSLVRCACSKNGV